jgi:hypothetical protein
MDFELRSHSGTEVHGENSVVYISKSQFNIQFNEVYIFFFANG